MADSGGNSAVTGVIRTVLGQDALFLEGFTAVERMSEPFRIVCDVVSPAPVDFDTHLGSGISLEVNGGENQVSRAFHGLLMEVSELETFDGSAHYSLVLRPWLSLLALNRRCRIFQHLSARDIIAKVFHDAQIDPSRWNAAWRFRGTVVREYCVQYNESDFDFVSRLMEEEGIYYYFAHTANQHVMTLCDGPASHEPFAGGDIVLNEEEGAQGPRLWSWSTHVKPTPTLSSMRDTHFKLFGQTLDASSNATSVSSVSAEIYQYPGAYSYLTDTGTTSGGDYARLRLQAARAEKTRYVAEGNVFAAPVGVTINVVPVQGDHSGRLEAVKILVTGAVHSFGGQKGYATQSHEGLETSVSLEGTPSADTWLPLLRTPKPVARGPQVGAVVGAAGEVIDVDAFGRVKVQFPWDREGTSDEGSSCWIRVSQGWADKNFGHLMLPRIGQEVIVDYLDGDMDRPVITGRLFNATATVPYGLPGEKTKSTWKSHTVGEVGQAYENAVNPPQGTDFGFNEIRYEDKSGAEEIYVHAQRFFNAWYRLDETRTTGRNTTIKVGYDRDTTVKRNETFLSEDGDEKHTVKTGKRETTIHAGDTLTVETQDLVTTVSSGDEKRTLTTGSRTTEIKQNETLTLHNGDSKITLEQGGLTTAVSLGNVSLKADVGTITYEAGQSIELKVGANSLKIDLSGVTITGTTVTVKGTTIAVQGSAMTTITGGVVKIN